MLFCDLNKKKKKLTSIFYRHCVRKNFSLFRSFLDSTSVIIFILLWLIKIYVCEAKYVYCAALTSFSGWWSFMRASRLCFVLLSYTDLRFIHRSPIHTQISDLNNCSRCFSLMLLMFSHFVLSEFCSSSFICSLYSVITGVLRAPVSWRRLL